MNVNYNTFAKSFAASRKNMKWEEIEYFLSILERGSILDIWCGSGRLLEAFQQHFWSIPDEYIWVDLSSGLLDEARKAFPKSDFREGNMLDIDTIVWKSTKFKNIFLIASFHHLRTLEEREELIQKLYILLEQWGSIYMTNWALDSEKNIQKYWASQILNSENNFWSSDFNIKFWESERFYHSFTLSELDNLVKSAGFDVTENRLFESKKNTITILQK